MALPPFSPRTHDHVKQFIANETELATATQELMPEPEHLEELCEAWAMALLKRAEAAEARVAALWREVRGYSSTCSTSHDTHTHPRF